ncbi:LysR substrate-binding domain-containing protein [Azospirillum griseum]|uniref:LysR family transcriptional regulator n=1 Tax=Azospirillum griseum TaxID=2496639 RepID=A0A3S0HXD3_9PROT|nr:LysR substrate-binding domain-containing protein [Azospirillum griseum]RTR15040.1 LysR family transcriptional regulator [Azospirillum griseum]
MPAPPPDPTAAPTPLPPLNALRAFDMAARHSNFRLAAEALGVTQSAVAQQVRHLEALLGLRLFERRGGGLVLTGAGRTYAGQLRRAFDLMVDATASLRPAPLRLTISVTPTFASKWLIPRLPTLTAAHPDLDLRVLAAESLSNFQTDGVDIAVRQGRPPFGPGLVADALFDQELVTVCSPACFAALGDGLPAPQASGPLPPTALARAVLLHDAHNQWPEFLAAVLPDAPTPTARGIRFSHSALAIDAALAGQGVALVSRCLVDRDLADGRLVRPFAGTLTGPLGFHIVSPRKPRHPEPTQRVRRWLLNQRPLLSQRSADTDA